MSKSIEAGEKLDYFLVGLCFAVLASAVQTAKFSPQLRIPTYFEVGGWTGLIISGFIGISKIQFRAAEWHYYERNLLLEDKIAKVKEKLKKYSVTTSENPENQFRELVEYAKESASRDVDEVVDEHSAMKKKIETTFNKIYRYTSYSFELLFLISIIMLAYARAYEPLKALSKGQ
jgi:hypothetical protein